MGQGTGHIRDFTKKVELPAEIQVKVARPQQEEIQRLSAITGVENDVEIHVHEELVVQGQNKLRTEAQKEGDPEIRLRVTDRAAWERVKRDEDDPS